MPSPKMKHPSWAQALFAILGAALFWSTSFVATKIALGSFPPITLGAIRLTLATLLLGLIVLLRKEFVLPPVKDLWRLAAGGLLGISIYFTLENMGLNLASAADGALLVASFPVITMLLEAVIFRLRLSWLRLSGALLAIVGVCLIVGADMEVFGYRRFIGDILFLLTGISWAFYNFVTRTVVAKYPLMTTNFIQTLVGTVTLYPFTLLESSHWQWSQVTLSAELSILYLGIFCSVVALLLYTYGLRRLDSGSAVSLLNLVPVFGVVFSMLVLSERVVLLQIAGGLIVIAGVSLSVNRKSSVS